MLPRNALIVVDVQNDFCPGGSLAVAEGDTVAKRIREFIDTHVDDYCEIVATKDWHPDDPFFPHFSATPDYITTWPMHCVAGTPGADFHPNLSQVARDDEDALFLDGIFYKGQRAAAYSGFEGSLTKDYDPNLSLDGYLKRHRITHVDVVGIATEKCVRATAEDALKNGYGTVVLSYLCAALSPEGADETWKILLNAGIHVDGWTS